MYPFELELAEQFGALFIAFEHRYYGTSLPFGSNTTVESLKYLTTVQAIMDITTLYTRMMDLFNLPTNTTWISFGCSYAGMLSAFSRMKLPNLITAAVSGSSPIEAKIDYIEFDETVENAIPEDCKTILIEVNRRIENLLLTPEGKIALQGMFNTCQPFDTQYEALGLEYLITETLQLLVQYNNPPDYPLPAFCQAILQSQEPMQVLANYMIPVNSCINLDVNNFQQMNADRAWFWQKFTEFGYYKNTPQNSQLFFPNINMGFHYMYMNLLFGFMMDPAQDETNQYFGGYNFSDVTNIIFTNGRTDPWSKLSKLQNVSDSVTSYIYDSAAHCAPYHEFNSAMQPDLIFVRDQIVAFLSEILNQQKKKNK
ncbi:protease s28 pro-x carboxypeptidase-related [Anaeramoeba ignava]|uniref:Protease s28 pro-x carboxypeptidase-related n=1 Tax=Anaeramoeba ignava TaxID=1746090 RepID=A0A9Q0RGR2_ANAIG|nr:protease s28 pro-x carboxypeptidase-related [Anaeramoeba ignava]